MCESETYPESKVPRAKITAVDAQGVESSMSNDVSTTSRETGVAATRVPAATAAYKMDFMITMNINEIIQEKDKRRRAAEIKLESLTFYILCD